MTPLYLNMDKANLKKRYLIWLYKTTKEALDRIDRKWTQLDIDKKISERLNRIKIKEDKAAWQKLLNEFSDYIIKKEKDAYDSIYLDKNNNFKADYLFLKNKFILIEEVIKEEFGKPELKRIQSLYNDEMIKRIIQEREHK